jgi:hypothetical protein
MPDLAMAASAALNAMRIAEKFGRVVTLACEASAAAEDAAAIAFVAAEAVERLGAAADQLERTLGDEAIRLNARREVARQAA